MICVLPPRSTRFGTVAPYARQWWNGKWRGGGGGGGRAKKWWKTFFHRIMRKELEDFSWARRAMRSIEGGCEGRMFYQ